VHRLRQVLPNSDAFLHIDRQHLSWRPNVPWTLDVLDFEDALTRANQAVQTGNTTATRQALAEAVKLYRGDLLPGCYDEWVLPECERLQQAFLRALEQLLLLLEQERDYSGAISAAQRLLRHDPQHEVTYRHLMRLYAAIGDRAAALRVYHNCATVLERELAVGPGRATREVYERLIRAEESTGSPEAKQSGGQDQQTSLPRNLATDGLQILAVTMTDGNSRMKNAHARLPSVSQTAKFPCHTPDSS
jgi:DNA-binding SARP family transcriptional activator